MQDLHPLILSFPLRFYGVLPTFFYVVFLSFSVSLNNSTWCPPAPPSLKAQNSFSCSSTMEESENEETVPHHEDNETIPHDDDDEEEEEGNNGIVPLREFVRERQ
eukprot:scaffold9899_cov55-Cylindrotheca_fusiformis.AAC.2